MFISGDMADLRVSVNGVPYGDSWSEAEGGNLEADVAKVRPGGMGNEKSAGGASSRQDLTVRIPYTDVGAPWAPARVAVNGDGDVTFSAHWLGRNKVPLGTSLTRTGTLQAVNVPDVGDGSAVGLFELVISCDE
jgi:hypothetical protein